jgi:branched-chain amino acid transport system substrate-binding protein
VPGIYTKLIDIDQVDLLISSYGTNLVVPAIPVAIAHNRLFFGLFALAANDQFHFPKYFSMLPFGPEPVKDFAQGWFDLAVAQNPKPKTVAIVATDAEFQHKAAESARQHAKARGIDIIYDRAYPPSTVDFTPIVRSVQAAQSDLVYIASYPSDTVGILRSVGELGLDTKMLGGGLAGLQAAAIKMQLGEVANGVVNVDLWEPVPTMQFPGVMDFIKKYQVRAPAEGVDLLGYFLPPFAYSELQILGDAIAATKTLDNDKLAEYMHSHPFRTIEGDIAFGPDGEWTEARPIWAQYHDIKGHDVEQFREPKTVTILSPPQYKTGEMTYPYTEARKQQSADIVTTGLGGCPDWGTRTSQWEDLPHPNRFHAACRDTASACPIVAQLTSRSRRMSTISCMPASILSNAPLYPARVLSSVSVGALSGNNEFGTSCVAGVCFLSMTA